MASLKDSYQGIILDLKTRLTKEEAELRGLEASVLIQTQLIKKHKEQIAALEELGAYIEGCG